ncbi:MAG: hypothetical protein HY474_01315 [Candidatus Sungbacteria bacterium]|uniref:Uncharacterized protein n=1 Tax=Candidatus Sungiibacteriota bacterium TaxID=2750080 RepID=A0A933DRK4_9BACT|nr:hypothetical protein [Candidatus Sungbacteria bacterium]
MPKSRTMWALVRLEPQLLKFLVLIAPIVVLHFFRAAAGHFRRAFHKVEP